MIIAVLCVIVEMYTTSFILLCLAIAAGIAGGAAFIGMEFGFQCIVFSVSTIFLLIFLRPLSRLLYARKNAVKLGVEAYIGKEYRLIEIDSVEGTGKVKIGSEIWKVRSIDKNSFSKGEVVQVKNVQGTTLLVEKIKE